jgi:hypothetical protein
MKEVGSFKNTFSVIRLWWPKSFEGYIKTTYMEEGRSSKVY